MEPIPLRTLTVLLNYERMISDPRFEGTRLFQESAAIPGMEERMVTQHPHIFKEEPRTVRQRNIHVFTTYKEPPISDPPSTICLIHPNALPAVQKLTFAQRENIYHETRGHDGCYKAIGLYQFFFDLCDPGQKISIQVTNEGSTPHFNPILVDFSMKKVIKCEINGPRLNTIASVPTRAHVMVTGSRDKEEHCVLGFPIPGSKDHILVDMTRMQYGEAGRGLYGEQYFLGTILEFTTSMAEDICKKVELKSLAMVLTTEGTENEARLKGCAEKVLQRWQNREKEGWCAHCGKGGRKLKRCGGCKSKWVEYCCKEHQVAGWKLHKHTCESKKAGGR